MEKVLFRAWKMLPALFLFLLIVLILILFARVKSENERIKAEKLQALHKERPPINVVVLDVKPMSIQDRLRLPARVVPWLELRVLAEVSGKVIEVPLKEGDYVDQNDTIALIDSRDYENDLASIQSELDLARNNLARAKNLFEEGLTTQAGLDADVARHAKLEAALKNASLRLERCNIKAPVSGVVNRLDAKKGLYMNIQDPVAVILDIQKVKVSVGIPESDVDEVSRISHFDVTVDALDGKTVTGVKYFLSKSPDPSAQLYRLDLEVGNDVGELLPGMFARVNIVKKEVRKSISVPLYAVIMRGDEQFVLVERDGKAHTRMVETGILEGWRIQVTKGLSVGDRVIVVGHRSLDEGQDVNVVRTVSDPEDLFN